MAGRRFTREEIGSFRWVVANGAKVADVAREHGFSLSSFRRWQRRYGVLVSAYRQPTDADRAVAQEWRAEPTLAGAWESYRRLAEDPAWESESELPNFPAEDMAEYERLTLSTRPDARVLLVCEKNFARDAIDRWAGPDRPSAAHASRAALAVVQSLPSAWACQTLYSHAKRLNIPIAFFGDLDPQSLHLFAALRAGGPKALLEGRRAGTPVHWVGLGERWLALFEEHRGSLQAGIIALNWIGREYWELVKRMVPDVRTLLGRRAVAMLDGGAKMEVDAWVTMARDPFSEEMRRRLQRLARRRPRVE